MFGLDFINKCVYSLPSLALKPNGKRLLENVVDERTYINVNRKEIGL